MDGLWMFHLIAGVPVDLCQDSIFCSARRGFGRRLPWFDLLIENMGLANTWDMEVRMQGEHLKHHPVSSVCHIFFRKFLVVERTFWGRFVSLWEIGVTWVGLPLAGWGRCDKTQQHLHTNLRFSGQLWVDDGAVEWDTGSALFCYLFAGNIWKWFLLARDISQRRCI